MKNPSPRRPSHNTAIHPGDAFMTLISTAPGFFGSLMGSASGPTAYMK
jgi:hypothetical protein